MSEIQELNSNESIQEKKDKETLENGLLIGLVFLVLMGIFFYYLGQILDNLEQAQREKQNKADKAYFLANGTFTCASSPIITSSRYFVSKENGWSIYDAKYFKKEDLLVDFKSCKRAKRYIDSKK